MENKDLKVGINHTRDRRLDDLYDLTMENNELLHSLLKREKISNFFKILYWGFIIATALGFYYKFDDITNYFLGNVSKFMGVNSDATSSQNIIPQLQEFIKTMNGININDVINGSQNN